MEWGRLWVESVLLWGTLIVATYVMMAVWGVEHGEPLRCRRKRLVSLRTHWWILRRNAKRRLSFMRPWGEMLQAQGARLRRIAQRRD